MGSKRKDEECAEILRDLPENENKQIMKKNETYRLNNELLVLHIDNQAEDVQYWRVAAPTMKNSNERF